jgi:hypothetical protein
MQMEITDNLTIQPPTPLGICFGKWWQFPGNNHFPGPFAERIYGDNSMSKKTVINMVRRTNTVGLSNLLVTIFAEPPWQDTKRLISLIIYQLSPCNAIAK